MREVVSKLLQVKLWKQLIRRPVQDNHVVLNSMSRGLGGGLHLLSSRATTPCTYQIYHNATNDFSHSTHEVVVYVKVSNHVGRVSVTRTSILSFRKDGWTTPSPCAPSPTTWNSSCVSLTMIWQVRKIPLRPHPGAAEPQGQGEGVHTTQSERMSGRNQGFRYGSVCRFGEVERVLMLEIRPQGDCALETRISRDVWP